MINIIQMIETKFTYEGI